jgi:hypothetical protein
MKVKPMTMPSRGDENSGTRILPRSCPTEPRRSRQRSPGRADQAADQGVAAGTRDRQAPSDQVPGDRPDAGRGQDRGAVGQDQVVLTMPLPIVPATAVPKTSAPTKLAVAESRIACSGLRALVATEVAMALAVSWKPLM